MRFGEQRWMNIAHLLFVLPGNSFNMLGWKKLNDPRPNTLHTFTTIPDCARKMWPNSDNNLDRTPTTWQTVLAKILLASDVILKDVINVTSATLKFIHNEVF